MGVLIAVPHTGEVKTQLVKQLLDWDNEEDVEVFFSNHRPVDVNRCHIAKYFLEETDHEHLMMVDSDIIPPDNTLELVEEGKDIISPLIFSMRDGVPYPCGVMLEDGKLRHHYGDTIDSQGFIEVDALGTGCIIIKREVLDAMEEPYFEFVKNEDGTINTGEDFDFCLRAKEAGFGLWMATDYVAGHLSNVDLSDFMRLLGAAFDMDKDEVFKY